MHCRKLSELWIAPGLSHYFNVLIEKGPDIRLITTDLEIQIETQIVDANQSGPDASITTGAKAAEILRVLPKEVNHIGYSENA